jgi:hypothetical protein
MMTSEYNHCAFHFAQILIKNSYHKIHPEFPSYNQFRVIDVYNGTKQESSYAIYVAN